jgi:hypothetical protein
MDRVAVIGPFTAENSETSRCYFAVSRSKNRGILRLSAFSLLFFGWKNSEYSCAAAFQWAPPGDG